MPSLDHHLCYFAYRAERTWYLRAKLIKFSFMIILMNSLGINEASAQNLSMTTPRVSAMGQAGIGGARANSALILNPAGMSAGAFYAVDANYFRSSEGANLLGINVVDSQTRYSRDRLALGLGYQALMKGGEATGHDARIGFSLPISKIDTSLLMMGASARYLYDETSQRDGFDLNAGFMLQISSILNIGLVGTELLEETQRSLGAGIGLSTQRLSLNLDFLQRLKEQVGDYRAGAEFMVSDSLVFRFGYLYHPSAPQSDRQDQSLLDLTLTDDLSTADDLQQWSGGLAIVGLGGGDGQLSASYTYTPSTKGYVFGLSLSTYLSMGINQ